MLSGGHTPRPRERQLADVLFVDLCERAVARTVVGAPPVNPLARLRLLEHRVGDGPKHAVADAEIPHLALHLRSEASAHNRKTCSCQQGSRYEYSCALHI
jgi:hypothetical protein